MTAKQGGAGTEAPGVTIREFAESMNVAYQTVQRWIEPGGMPLLGWLEIGGRRFVRLDPVRCREWALANRPALAGAGPGGWRPGSGRPKAPTKAKVRGTRPRGPNVAAARADGVTGTFVPNTEGTVPAPQPSVPPASAAVVTPPPNPYLEAKTAALIAEVKVKELKYQQLAGKVLDKDEVVRSWTDMLQRIATQISLIAPAAARDIASILELNDASLVLVERAIEEQVTRVRAALADSGHTPTDLSGAANDVTAAGQG